MSAGEARFTRDQLGLEMERTLPGGNVLSVRDQHYDVQFTYPGMGRLASRTQEGRTVKFEYDKEDALVAIHDEAGAVYRFKR